MQGPLGSNILGSISFHFLRPPVGVAVGRDGRRLGFVYVAGPVPQD